MKKIEKTTKKWEFLDYGLENEERENKEKFNFRKSMKNKNKTFDVTPNYSVFLLSKAKEIPKKKPNNIIKKVSKTIIKECTSKIAEINNNHKMTQQCHLSKLNKNYLDVVNGVTPMIEQTSKTKLNPFELNKNYLDSVNSVITSTSGQISTFTLKKNKM